MPEKIVDIIDYLLLTYSVLLVCIYVNYVLLSYLETKKNKKTYGLSNVTTLIKSTNLPSITLIAPAFNEANNIIENVNSLLGIQYPKYKLIISNDGSHDDTLKNLIEEFDLVLNGTKHDGKIKTREIKGIYKSRSNAYRNLTVIDKINGGRADALNAGINYSDSELIVCTDADCIIDQFALLKMVRPFLEETKKEVLSCGSGIGIANESKIIFGTIKQPRVPRNILTRIQVVEYMRAFLLGRMAWSRVNGLMLVSGAFGLYKRSRLLEIGGFNTETVGEDLELLIRLRAHAKRLKIPHVVHYIPETLCWTEAPDNYKIFIKQRDRWARGLWESLSIHRKILFNPRYGTMGMIILPYWVLFEFLVPFVEFAGLIIFIVYGILGIINWVTTIKLLICVLLISYIISATVILFYVKDFASYPRKRQITSLLTGVLLEPFIFHPVLVYAEIKGYFKKIFGLKSDWGTMTRKGFSADKN